MQGPKTFAPVLSSIARSHVPPPAKSPNILDSWETANKLAEESEHLASAAPERGRTFNRLKVESVVEEALADIQKLDPQLPGTDHTDAALLSRFGGAYHGNPLGGITPKN